MSATAQSLPEQWVGPIQQWEAKLRADGFADSTIRDRVRAVRRAAHGFDGSPWDVTTERLTAYAGQQEWNDLTRGTWVRTMRLFYEYARSQGWTDQTPTPDRRAALVLQPAATVWSVELAAWAAWLTASDQSAHTITQRTYHLRRLACAYPELGPWDLDLDDLTGWLGSLAIGTNSRRVIRQSLRAFYRWGATTGRVRVDPSAELPAVRGKRGVPRPAPEDVISAALAVAGERERDAIELAATAGLRQGEIARVRIEDVTRQSDGWWLHVVGKGGQQRSVPLSDALGERLASRPAGWLFPSPGGGHLTPSHLGVLLRRVLPGRSRAHSLRHRFASRAYSGERDIIAVRDLLGHANVTTTQVYTAVPDGARRAAVRAAAAIG